MIDSLLSSPTTRMLEQTVNFTEERHSVLVEDIANTSTPEFVQRDLSVKQFQSALRKAITKTNDSPNNDFEPESTDDVDFFPGSSAISTNAGAAPNSVVFHDRGVHNMEYLMSQMADNAIAHNMAAQFLKARYDQIGRAISMKV